MCVAIQIKTVHLNVKSVKEIMLVFLLRMLCIISACVAWSKMCTGYSIKEL